MPEIRTVGIVLRRTNYAEADRILRVFTREEGMISAIAKGVRRAKSKKAASLELFQLAELQLLRRTGELFLVTQASGMPAVQPTPTALPQLAVWYAVAEWLLALLPAEKAVPEIFDLLQDVSAQLSQTDRPEMLQLAAQSQILEILGFLPGEFRDPTTQKIVRFCAQSQLADACRLTGEPAAFRIAGETLEKIFHSLTDRDSRVPGVTTGWHSA